jgi:hypothetical protein
VHGVVAQPSYPSLRAWPDTADYFFGPGAPSLPFTHYSRKRRFRDGIEFGCAARPVGAIVCLGDAETATDRVVIRDLHGHASGAAVVGAAKNMPLGTRKLEAFQAHLDLADDVPVVRATGPRGFERVGDLCSRLVNWTTTL